MNKLKFSFSQIINMNIGFLGIQYSFGLQQTAINPLYSFLGANPEELPLLNLAGPLTGLIIQPIIGAMSDRTWSNRWGRRKPYFLIGALACSLCLLAFPFSSTLWMAAGLLWILDAANNTAMEPYRALIADTLTEEQQPTGFLAQSFFTGLGITLANFSLFLLQKLFVNQSQASNQIPTWVYGAFFIGAVVSITSVWFSTSKIKEYPPSDEELSRLRNTRPSVLRPLAEIFEAIKTMPRSLWQLALVYLFQWYALFIYWQFVSLSVAKNIFHTDSSNQELYSKAAGWTGVLNGTYNLVTICVAFYLVKLAKNFGPKKVHAASLFLAAIALIGLPLIQNQYMTLIPMIGLGIAWASIMGVPYIMVVPLVPENKYGVYMGIINMMIVVPMIIQTLSFSFVYTHLLNKDPNYAISFGGILLFIAGLLTLRIRTSPVVK